MSAEMQQAIDTLGQEWTEYKAVLDRHREEAATKGYVTGEIEAMLLKVDAAVQAADDRKADIDRMASAMERIETALARSPRGGDPVVTPEQEQHREALCEYMRHGENATELRGLEKQALTRGTDTAGGYWVTPERAETIVTTIFETSPMRQVASVRAISTDALVMPDDYDEAAASWAGESASVSESSTPALGEIRIPVHELRAMPKASQQLLEDSEVDPEVWLADKVADKFSRTENTAFISGTGAGQPRGILGTTKAIDSGSGVARGSVGYMKTGVNGAWKANTPGDNLIDLMFLLKSGYDAAASFLARRSTIGTIRKFSTSTYAYVWEPSFTAGVPATILGKPVYSMEDVPAIANDSYSVAYGDFRSAYQIVDRIGISVLRDPFSSKPFVLFYTRKRVGADVVNYEAIKLLQFKA